MCVDTATGATRTEYPTFPPNDSIDCEQSKSYNMQPIISIELTSSFCCNFQLFQKILALSWSVTTCVNLAEYRTEMAALRVHVLLLEQV